MQHTIRFATGLAAFALVTACADNSGSSAITAPPSASRVAASGTTLSATKTATGFREDRLEYDWSVKKTLIAVMAGPQMLNEALTGRTTVRPDDPRWLEYRIQATRNDGTRYSATGVRGNVCVTNGGSLATQGLAITDVVQTKTGSGPYQDYVSSPVDVSSKPVLAAGESYCYPYEIAVTPQAGALYRNTARVTITNHSGYLGQPFGPGSDGGVKADFTIPTTSTAVTRDASAKLDDQMLRSCYNVFPSLYCSWGASDEARPPATITKSATFDFMVDLYNHGACGETYPFTNTVALTESGPRASGEAPQVRRDSTTLQVNTGDCAPKPAHPGCTLTVGYWKNHAWPADFWYMEEVSTLSFFDTGYTWQGILGVEPKGDAYIILAHQYVAARLNQIGDHSYVPPQVVSVLQSAHDYFSLSPAARALVDRNTIIGWANLLDQYNNGKLGVPHCS